MPGFSSFWYVEGALHPLQTPAHLILMIGLGLLLGQQLKTYAIVRDFLLYTLIFLFAIITGFILNRNLSLDWNIELILLALSLIAGLLVILRINLSAGILAVLLISSGVFIGLDSSPMMIPGLKSSSIDHWFAGAAISIVTVVLLLSFISLGLRRFLEGIILRVLGSWIATSAIFVLALALAGH